MSNSPRRKAIKRRRYAKRHPGRAFERAMRQASRHLDIFGKLAEELARSFRRCSIALAAMKLELLPISPSLENEEG